MFVHTKYSEFEMRLTNGTKATINFNYEMRLESTHPILILNDGREVPCHLGPVEYSDLHGMSKDIEKGEKFDFDVELDFYSCGPGLENAKALKIRVDFAEGSMFKPPQGGHYIDHSIESAPIPLSGKLTSEQAILYMMQGSVDDWNRHDIDAFATCYKNSPDILFIGRKTSRGYDQMVATYKANYNTPEKMGTLSFTGLETQPLDANFSTVTGHFHLDRTAAGGGNADGYFLLVVEHTPSGWKIVRDDSTSLPPPAAKSDAKP